MTKKIKLTDATGRVTRQSLYLEQYDFETVYKKGKQNVIADGLSIIPSVKLNLQELSNECQPNDALYGPEMASKFKNQIIIRFSRPSEAYLSLQLHNRGIASPN